MTITKEGLLAYFSKINYKRYKHITSTFSSFDNAWSAPAKEYYKRIPWKQSFINEFIHWRDTLDITSIQQVLERESITCIPLSSNDYPQLLKEIHDPPIALFVKGRLQTNDFAIAVVGTRKYTDYGRYITNDIVQKLAAQGITIVSGLAFGIDRFAHEAALDAKGYTIAVLGSGIDTKSISPSTHLWLAENIIENGGAVISEYPPGTQAAVYTFPERNRIIAGLSKGTLVTEAARRSGALITATCSLEENREVFAIPHNITNRGAAGTNDLIKQGAHVVTSAEDILNVLDLKNIEQYIDNRNTLPHSPVESLILRHISQKPTHIDELLKKINLSQTEITSSLTLMEMKGIVKNIGNMMYTKI